MTRGSFYRRKGKPNEGLNTKRGRCSFASAAAPSFLLRKFRPNPILVMVLCGAAGLVLGLLGIQV